LFATGQYLNTRHLHAYLTSFCSESPARTRRNVAISYRNHQAGNKHRVPESIDPGVERHSFSARARLSAMQWRGSTASSIASLVGIIRLDCSIHMNSIHMNMIGTSVDLPSGAGRPGPLSLKERGTRCRQGRGFTTDRNVLCCGCGAQRRRRRRCDSAMAYAELHKRTHRGI
jgi:hypothetical protein